MLQSFLYKILMAPLAFLYGIGVSIHQGLYRFGLQKAVKFSVPTISVGNLSIGGTGKTPHVEYLIRLLKDYVNVVTLSRGYNRKTSGFKIVQPNDLADQVGDEPLQYRRKFNDIGVTVAEMRTYGIMEIMKLAPNTQTILLDDAFQHRAVDAGLHVILTDYSKPFYEDFLLPAGRLREWRSGYKRADVIIVSKCPGHLTQVEADAIITKIQPLPHQKIFFTQYKYHAPYYIFNPQHRIQLDNQMDSLLICAIANTDYLASHLETQVASVKMMEFEDHHYFSKYELGRAKDIFDRIESDRKLILTTEKDAMRLEMHKDYLIEQKIPIFVLPVEVDFLFEGKTAFDALMHQYLLGFTA